MSNKKTNLSITVIVILFLLAIGFIYGLVKKPTKSDLYQECYSFSQFLVKEKLKSPQSADFPWYNDSFITDKGDTIIVNAYVDAQNSFGATVRTKYTATITIKDNKPDKGYVTLLE